MDSDPATLTVPTATVPLMRTCFPCTGADLAAARSCERVVFGRYYGNTPAQLRAAYEAYEPDTSFGAVLAADGRAVGAVRILQGGRTGLKTLRDAAGHPWWLEEGASRDAGIRPEHTWDVASFGVDSLRARGWSRKVTMALLSIVFGAMQDNGVETFLAIVDSAARRPLAALGIEMIDVPGTFPAPYLGSPASVPVYQHFRTLHDLHAARFAPTHQQVFHGRDIPGLDPCMSSTGSFRLPATAA